MNLPSPSVGLKTEWGKWAFRVATIAAPFAVPVMIELQNQIRGRALDWWTLAELGMGAVISLFVAVFHIQRVATEHAETKAEVRTNVDQDDDGTAEQTPGQITGATP